MSAITPKTENLKVKIPSDGNVKALKEMRLDELSMIIVRIVKSNDMIAKKQFLTDGLVAAKLLLDADNAETSRVTFIVGAMSDVFKSIPPDTKWSRSSQRHDALFQMALHGGGLRSDVQTMFVAQVKAASSKKESKAPAQDLHKKPAPGSCASIPTSKIGFWNNMYSYLMSIGEDEEDDDLEEMIGGFVDALPEAYSEYAPEESFMLSSIKSLLDKLTPSYAREAVKWLFVRSILDIGYPGEVDKTNLAVNLLHEAFRMNSALGKEMVDFMKSNVRDNELATIIKMFESMPKISILGRGHINIRELIK